MPDERREWGTAMQAELAHIRQPFKRWQFVWAAGWLFMLWDQMPCFLGGVPGCD